MKIKSLSCEKFCTSTRCEKETNSKSGVEVKSASVSQVFPIVVAVKSASVSQVAHAIRPALIPVSIGTRTTVATRSISTAPWMGC